MRVAALQAHMRKVVDVKTEGRIVKRVHFGVFAPLGFALSWLPFVALLLLCLKADGVRSCVDLRVFVAVVFARLCVCGRLLLNSPAVPVCCVLCVSLCSCPCAAVSRSMVASDVAR